MNRTRFALALTASAALLSVAACGGGSNPLSTSSAGGGSAGSGSTSGGSASGGSGSGGVIVGSANFPENELLAEIYAGALTGKGVKVQTRLNIGSRETYIPALRDGSIDLIPEYTGVLAQYFNKNANAVTSDAVYAELKAALPSTLTVLAKSAAEDKDAVVVTKATADKLHLTSISDLQGKAQNLTLGGPPEWKTRPTGVPGLKKVYGLTFKSFRPLDAGGPLSVEALKNGQVDAVNLFTTDPNIPADNFVVLQDPKHLFAAQNVVPLISKSKVTPTITTTLDAVSAKLDTSTLAELVKEVVIDKLDPSTVANKFLKQNSLS